MKGLVYNGPGKIELKEVPKPVILKPTDALIRILKSTICGTDLGILKGKTPSVQKGTIHCEDGGWLLANIINGTQAEYVRIPHADNSLHHVPEGADEEWMIAKTVRKMINII